MEPAPDLYTPYKRFTHDKQFDHIIIGSGISGLALAAILAKEGKKVAVLEQHYTPGGATHTFTRNSYEWDVGLHYVGEVGQASNIVKQTFDYVCDSPVQWADMGDVYDRVFFGEESYEFRKGRQQFTGYFVDRFPHEKDAIERYVKLLFTMENYGMTYFAEKMIPRWAGALIGPMLRSRYLSLASKTTKEVMDALFRDHKLRAVLTSQFGDCGLPPSACSFAMHAAVARHYLEGGFYPVGGSSAIFQRIAPVIKKNGGEIFVRAVAREIIIANGKAVGVIMQDGKEMRAKSVVSTTGFESTFRRLLPREVRMQKNIRRCLTGLKPSVSFVCLYIGLKHTATELNLPRSNFWVFPDRYDHDRNTAEHAAGVTDKLPVVYISFPGAKDPDFENRYPGRTTIEIITLVDYNAFNLWEDKKWRHRGEAYEALKEQVSEKLLRYLYKYLPATRGKVDYYELSTPLSAKHFTGHEQGELYGLDHTPARFANKWLTPATPVRGLYMAGQDIVTAGVGGALISAVLCASVMTGRNYFGRIGRAAKR